MPKEKFVRRHLTDEEKHKFLRMDRELTDDEIDLGQHEDDGR